MKVLITSGGTKVPIDPVRDITNLSNGTFGSKLAKQFLDKDHEVHLFCAKRSRTPFKFEYDFASDNVNPIVQVDRFQDHAHWCWKKQDQYQESQFRNYEDYRSGLEKLIKEQKPDVVLLAAAVSDYVVKKSEEKARSQDEMSIELHPAEKIISKVKEWHPSTFLVGFKLLVGVPQEELIEAAMKSIEGNGCDLVIANDLNSLKAGNHEVLLVERDKINILKAEQVEGVVNSIEELANA